MINFKSLSFEEVGVKPELPTQTLPALRPVEILEVNALLDTEQLLEMFSEIKAEIDRQELLLQVVTVSSAEDFEDSSKMVATAKKLIARLEEARKLITKPLDTAKKTVMQFEEVIAERLNIQIKRVEAVRTDFAKVEEKKRKAEIAKIEAEAKERTGDEVEDLLSDLETQARIQQVQAENPTLKNVRKSYTAKIIGNPITTRIKLLTFYLGKGKGDWSKIDEVLLRFAEKTGCPPIDGVVYEESLKAVAR